MLCLGARSLVVNCKLKFIFIFYTLIGGGLFGVGGTLWHFVCDAGGPGGCSGGHFLDEAHGGGRRLANARDDLVGERRDGRSWLCGLQFAEHMALVVGSRTGATRDEGENGSAER